MLEAGLARLSLFAMVEEFYPRSPDTRLIKIALLNPARILRTKYEHDIIGWNC